MHRSRRTRTPGPKHEVLARSLSKDPTPRPDPSSPDNEAEDGDDEGDSLHELEAPGLDLIDHAPSPPISVAENLPLSPLEDTQSYIDLIKKMAARLGLSTTVTAPPVEDNLFDVLRAHTSKPIAIPVSQVVLNVIQACWDKPASVPVSNKKLDHMYRTQEENVTFLFKHPQPNSLIVSSSSRSHRHHSTPPDTEGKKLDAYGRHLYSVGALGIKSNNYAACFSRYIHTVFEDLEPILQTLPPELKPKALQLCADGAAATRQNIATARHGLETSSKTLTTGVALRRHS